MFGNVREWTGEVGEGAGEVSEGTGEVGEETGEVGEDTGNVKDKFHTPAYRSIDLTSHRTYLPCVLSLSFYDQICTCSSTEPMH